MEFKKLFEYKCLCMFINCNMKNEFSIVNDCIVMS